MKAIVTGATGFIGSWMVMELINHSYEVLVVVRDRDRLLNEILESDKVTIIQKDINQLVAGDIQIFYGADVCYNFAWMGVRNIDKNCIERQIQNIDMTLNLLEVCKLIRCKRFVSAGTVAEYTLEQNKINPNGKASPIDYYGAAKAATRIFVEVKARQLEIPFNWIIISSTYGERRDDNSIISYTIKSLLNNKKPEYGRLDKMWDFIYVGDVVRAVRLIGERGKENKTYAVGTGENHTLSEYIEKIKDLIDTKAELKVSKGLNKNETISSCVDIDDLKRDTGFVATVSFEEGIKNTIEWFVEQKK